jgi:hypothetical protein
MSTQEHIQEDAVQTAQQSSVADGTSQTDRRTVELADVVSIQDAFALLPKRHLKYRCKSRNFQLFLSTINVTHHRCNYQYSTITAVMNLPVLCVSIASTAISSNLPALYPVKHIALPCNSCTVFPDITLHCVWFEIMLQDSLGRAQVFYYCWYINKNFSFKM